MAEIKVEISGDVLRASVGATVLLVERVGGNVYVKAGHIDELILRDGTAYLYDETTVKNAHLHGHSSVKGSKDVE